jgi:hypothetical protein
MNGAVPDDQHAVVGLRGIHVILRPSDGKAEDKDRGD